MIGTRRDGTERCELRANDAAASNLTRIDSSADGPTIAQSEIVGKGRGIVREPRGILLIKILKDLSKSLSSVFLGDEPAGFCVRKLDDHSSHQILSAGEVDRRGRAFPKEASSDSRSWLCRRRGSARTQAGRCRGNSSAEMAREVAETTMVRVRKAIGTF
jgi:hypothetical protein